MLTLATCSGLFIIHRCARKHEPLPKPDHDHEDGDYDDDDDDGVVAGVANDGVVAGAGVHNKGGVVAMSDAAHDSGALQIEAARAPIVDSGGPDLSLLAMNVRFEA